METVEKEFVHDVTEECKDKLEDWSDFWWNELRSKFRLLQTSNLYL